MPDAYSYGNSDRRRIRPPGRPFRVLLPVVVVGGLVYLLVFAPDAPFVKSMIK